MRRLVSDRCAMEGIGWSGRGSFLVFSRIPMRLSRPSLAIREYSSIEALHGGHYHALRNVCYHARVLLEAFVSDRSVFIAYEMYHSGWMPHPIKVVGLLPIPRVLNDLCWGKIK
jgi:hypothetical protein